jgi:endonuclease/exonuclease/phosphatase family metal-dependent hydrolase
VINYKIRLARRNVRWGKIAAVVVAVGLVVAAILLAVFGLGGDDQADAGSAPLAAEPMRLDVLVFNVEYGGGPATDRVIRRVDADVVGVLESYNRLPEIARRTGYRYYNVSLQLLSKYPILEPSGGGGLYALIEVKPGYVVPFFNHHLDYVEWGPRALRKGASVASVVENENEVRTSALAQSLTAMGGLIDQGYPVFLTGDFNEPSSLDYTAETVGTRKGVNQPVPWPVSKALLGIGLRDTYREMHPDPLRHPAITQESSRERIDYVYAGGPSRTLESKVVGERGGRDVAIEFSPWTSDHRAVLSSFETTPAAMPTLVAVDGRMRTVGDEIAVTYNAPGSDRNTIAVVPEGGDPAAALERLDAPGPRGTATLDTSGMDPGGYEAVLLDGDGSEIARISFWLRDPHAELRLRTDKRTYERGEPIRVTWTDGPANRWDWLGVYKAGAADPKTDSYSIWAYTGLHASGTLPPSTHGGVTLGRDTQGRPWPLPPGRYVVHYLLTDQYRSAASARFTVSGGGRS